MNPAQIEHLKKIELFLDQLLSIAEKRTKGVWERSSKCYVQCGSEVVADIWETTNGEILANTEFIVACAGNAEAGWRSTKAAIYQGMWLLELAESGRISLQDQGATYNMLSDILAEWPLERITV